MTKLTPKVSVCIPVFNAGALLYPAIDSVLVQEFADFELIIVDDGSSDEPTNIVQHFSDPRIRYCRFEEHAGLPRNWNRCIELSRGEFVALFHQDDLMLEGNLKDKIEVLVSNPSVGFVYSDVVSINAKGVEIGGHHIKQLAADTVFPGCELYRMVAESGNPVACSSVIVRSECYTKLGSYNVSLPFATDLEMWLRIAAHHDIGFVGKQLVAQRIHTGQESARFQSTGRDYYDVMHALDRITARSLPSRCSQYLTQSYRTLCKQSIPMARWQLREGNLHQAFVYMRVAFMSYCRYWSRRALQ